MLQIIQTTIRFMPVFFWLGMVVVTFLMLAPVTPTKLEFNYLDKVEHVFVFMVLAGMGLITWRQRKASIVFGLAFYGALMEVAQQTFTTYRQATVGDWVADVVGVVLAFMIYIYFVNRGFRLGIADRK